MKFEQHLSQQQKQVQKLAMTQQLQQSIQILQFNSEELTTYIESKALENPLLEVQLPEVEPVYSKSSLSSKEETNYLNQIPDNHVSLFEYLIEQIHLNYRATYLRTLVFYLVEYIDVNGYLTIDLAKAQEQTGATAIEMLDALTLLQRLDPAGVGARNIQECLMLQTERNDSAPHLAYIVLEEEFDALVQRQWQQIAKKFSIELSDVQQIFDFIQTLTPAPGSLFHTIPDLYIRPDLTVKEIAGQLQVYSNKKAIPAIRFQKQYFEKMAATNDKEVQEYIKEKKQEFDWLEKVMYQRGETILRVGRSILSHQSEFFVNSSHPLKPLLLKDIAKELAIHESTVSRAVNGKYLETDFGVFELRSFFSQGFTSTIGNKEALSTNMIKQQVKTLIDEENKKKPLSDQKIADLLKEQGTDISRRTVTKYREALGISTSSKRKRYDE